MAGQQQQQGNEIPAEDRQRFESYADQEWTGTVKKFNVSKGFGFIIPHHEEAERHGYELFAHQREIQMEGFRSLAVSSQVKFRVAVGQRGLEARNITNLQGGEPGGHHVHPGQIRCYNCSGYGHIAKKCKEPRVEGTTCNHCGSTEHLYATCPARAPQQ